MDDKRTQMKKLFERLHNGESLSNIKDEFSELIKDVSPAEISAVEEDLIKGGMPQEEIHKLCDVHMAVLKEKLDTGAPLAPVGHPVHILMEEHKAILAIANELRDIANKIGDSTVAIRDSKTHLIDISHNLADSENHYVREENVLFPYLEKHGITQPPAVMWMEHDQIRKVKKDFQTFIESSGNLSDDDFTLRITELSLALLELLSNHFYKENNILFPAAIQVIPQKEWPEIRQQFDDLGYCCFTSGLDNISSGISIDYEEPQKMDGKINFETGSLTYGEIEAIFNNLPVDITFVGKDDTVRFFSQTRERIFPRAKAVIGRTVQMCHPQKSIDKVNQIVGDFKNKRRDSAEFWINLKGRLVYIRYFPVHDSKGEYLGTMEVTQDITDIKKIESEKRLLD